MTLASIKPMQSTPGESLERQLERAMMQPNARGKAKAFLMVSTGQAAGTVFPVLQRSLLIGRSLDADVFVNEKAISYEHARLEQKNGGFTLQDLDSTNGTYVNGQRLVNEVVLAGGDSIRMGSTCFTFVTRESQAPKGTVRLQNPDFESPLEPRHPRSTPPSVELSAPPPSEFSDSVSLTDVVRRARRVWRFTRRYGQLLAACAGFGVAAGLVQLWIHPPPGAAWFEMSLVVASDRANTEEGPQFFVGAESTFRSLPLIEKTLTAMGTRNVNDAIASDLQSALSFEREGYNSKVYRGTYQDARADMAVKFLKTHVQVYIDSELDKVLKALRGEAEFDREQEQQASQRVAEARDQLIAFSDEHPEAVPKNAKLPDEAVGRLAPGASAERVKQSIVATRRALRVAFTHIQSKKAQPYYERAAAADSKIAEAHARGLRDEHPEVKNLLNLKAAMSAKANALLAADPAPSEQELDPQIVSLKEELADLEGRLEQLPQPVAGEDKSPATSVTVAPIRSAGVSPVASAEARGQSLSQLKIHYAELARDYERYKTEQEALAKKRETTDRQLERERTSAEARYAIITPPTAVKASMFAAGMKRGTVGGMVGLGLALIAAAGLELRRVLRARGHI
jgi:pSer/pThr/pTyr-binding forkhead associated (FHA) protein